MPDRPVRDSAVRVFFSALQSRPWEGLIEKRRRPTSRRWKGIGKETPRAKKPAKSSGKSMNKKQMKKTKGGFGNSFMPAGGSAMGDGSARNAINWGDRSIQGNAPGSFTGGV
jgi:hypothetical protein